MRTSQRLTLALLGLALALPAAAQTPADEIAAIRARLDALSAELPAPPVLASTADELKAALAKGGAIDLVPGAVYEGTAFKIAVPGTVVNGHDASLVGPDGFPGLDIQTSDAQVNDLVLGSLDDQSALRCGHNDATQTTLDQVPRRIHLRNVRVPMFLGKRGFEINCADVDLDHVSCGDVHDPGGRDSQCVVVSNSPGNIHAWGGTWSAGSEPFLVGGDWIKLRGIIPTNILVEGVHITRPIAWRTDGVKRVVKNLVELKTGVSVTLRNLELDGCWADAQYCYAVIATPRLGGLIQHVHVDGLNIHDVNACFEFLGADDAHVPTAAPLSDVTVTNTHCSASVAYGTSGSALGIFALLTGGVHDAAFTNNTITVDGTRLVVVDGSGHILSADGTTTVAPPPMAQLTFADNRATATKYSFMLGGGSGANATGDYSATVASITVTGNTFADAASPLKKAFPSNIYVDRATFDALVVQASGGF